jgi:thymidylate synthase
LPRLAIRRRPDSIFDYEYDDFEILNYEAHPHIRAAVAV